MLKFPDQTTLKMIILESAAILILAAIAGFGYNALSGSGIPLVAKVVDIGSTGGVKIQVVTNNIADDYPDLKIIDTATAYAYFRSDTAIFIDAREPDEYHLAHIPGAINVPMERYNPAAMNNIGKNQLLIIYCSDPDCHLAIDLAYELRNPDYTRVLIFHEGMAGWLKAGYPVAEAAHESH